MKFYILISVLSVFCLSCDLFSSKDDSPTPTEPSCSKLYNAWTGNYTGTSIFGKVNTTSPQSVGVKLGILRTGDTCGNTMNISIEFLYSSATEKFPLLGIASTDTFAIDNAFFAEANRQDNKGKKYKLDFFKGKGWFTNVARNNVIIEITEKRQYYDADAKSLDYEYIHKISLNKQ
jgi:hypothetical protein